MADLSDFKRGPIVGAPMADPNVTKTAKLFGIARSTVLKVMTAFNKEGKTSSLKQNSGNIYLKFPGVSIILSNPCRVS